MNETLRILSEAATINCREIPNDILSRLEQKSWQMRNSRPPSYWTIWDGKTPRRFIVMLHWNWSVSVVVYTVMILMIRLLGVKYMHVNTFCLGKFTEGPSLRKRAEVQGVSIDEQKAMESQ